MVGYHSANWLARNTVVLEIQWGFLLRNPRRSRGPRRLRHKFFPVNFANFLRTPFL